VKCNIEVYDQENRKIYEIAEMDYKLGSDLYGTAFDEGISAIDVNDSLVVSGRLPDEILRSIDAEVDFSQDQIIKVLTLEKFSESALPTWFSEKRLKLGLDLQGGMHLVLEVDTEGQSVEVAESSVKGALEIIRNRVDQFGVSEPTIHRVGDNRILVQLPGLRDASRAKELIGKTALLEFKLLANNEDITQTVDAIDDYLENNYDKYAYLKKIKETTEEKTAVEESLFEPEEELFQEGSEETEADKETETEIEKEDSDTTSVPLEEKEKGNLFSSLVAIYGQTLVVKPENLELFRKVIVLPEVTKIIPSGIEILLGKVSPDDPFGARPLYFLYDQVELTGASLKSADVRIGQGMDPKLAGKPYVGLEFDNEGAKIFSKVTGQSIGKRLAIVLDNIVHSAPRINDKIRTGSAMITGSFTMSEAKDLAIILQAGNLPSPVNIIEERTVGPSLGSDSIKAGFNAAIIGLVIVVLFMVFYYKTAGFIANIALVCNVLIIMALLTMLKATLTMPGIAGIILTIGMAVDANVLIFERIREELDSGKTVRTAIDNGYKRAIITIADANVTTLITALVLYQFGTGPIKGFAVTLSLGILSSMFTAIVLTKFIFDKLIANKPRKSLSI
jgi:SecD/SecF fusion protein